ncbi:hypothetical protein BT69DRAFT_200950 [Atractiella rhizophila]|nr:hypothetical protein BT69DRAFT_200950 [Atractiella rhizophila]
MRKRRRRSVEGEGGRCTMTTSGATRSFLPLSPSKAQANLFRPPHPKTKRTTTLHLAKEEMERKGKGRVDGEASSASLVPDVDQHLESLYLSNPSLFNRDSQTRRSKERAALKLRTGLGDEQIEGWRIVLERDPARLRRLKEKEALDGGRSGRVEGERKEKVADGEGQSARGGRGDRKLARVGGAS